MRAQPSVRQGDELLTYHPTPSVPIQTRVVTSHTNLTVTMPLCALTNVSVVLPSKLSGFASAPPTLWLPFAVRQVNVSVLKVLRGGSSSLESPVMKIEAKALIRRPSGRGGWVSLNIEELVARWFENPKDNHGIVVHATDELDRQIVVTDHEEDNGALVSVATLQACLCRDRGRCRSMYSMAVMVRGS